MTGPGSAPLFIHTAVPSAPAPGKRSGSRGRYSSFALQRRTPCVAVTTRWVKGWSFLTMRSPSSLGLLPELPQPATPPPFAAACNKPEFGPLGSTSAAPIAIRRGVLAYRHRPASGNARQYEKQYGRLLHQRGATESTFFIAGNWPNCAGKEPNSMSVAISRHRELLRGQDTCRVGAALV